MKLNTKKTQIIIQRFSNKTREKKFILSLNSYPKLQLKYLKKLFEEKEANKIIDDDLICLLLKLLCKTAKNEVLMWLKKLGRYPISECTEIVKKYKILDAEVYLLERSGAV